MRKYGRDKSKVSQNADDQMIKLDIGLDINLFSQTI